MLKHFINRLDDWRARSRYPLSDWRELDRFAGKPFYFYHQIIGNNIFVINVLWRESNDEVQLSVAGYDPTKSKFDVLERRSATQEELSMHLRFIGENDFSLVKSRVKSFNNRGLVHCFAIENEGGEPCFSAFLQMQTLTH